MLSNINKIFETLVNEPPFRGVGGQKKAVCQPPFRGVGGLNCWGAKIMGEGKNVEAQNKEEWSMFDLI